MADAVRNARRNLTSTRVVAVRGDSAVTKTDHLAGEEPMEIRAGGPRQDPVSVAVTMRTPGRDFDLAVGFLFTEGLIVPGEVDRVAYCDSLVGDQEYNVVTVRLNRAFDPSGLKRHFFAGSSCGICGKATLDQVAVHCAPVDSEIVVPKDALVRMPDEMRRTQRIFEATGGLHAAALFDDQGRLSLTREDVGRHNAADKLIGSAFLSGKLPLADRILMVSGRCGFEIVQKAAMAGVPVVCSVSAPSSLAIDAAERFGVTVVGFLRDTGFNVYSHEERVAV